MTTGEALGLGLLVVWLLLVAFVLLQKIVGDRL